MKTEVFLSVDYFFITFLIDDIRRTEKFWATPRRVWPKIENLHVTDYIHPTL